MAVLHILRGHQSLEYPLDLPFELTDAEVRHIALDALRSRGEPELGAAPLSAQSLDALVVDRFTDPGGQRRIWLRPVGPFGGQRSA